MHSYTRLILGAMALVLSAGLAAADPGAKGFACSDYSGGKVFLVRADGTVAFEYPAPSCNEMWVLANGNFLFTTGHGVREVTQEKKVVFAYDSRSEIYAAQRLPNGNTFVGECNAGRLLELAPDGKVVKELRLLPEGQDGGHLYMRNARRLANGSYLVTHYGQQVVREYDAQGKVVAEFKAPGGPHSATRLPNGNTLISTGDTTRDPRVLEYDREGKLVWEISNKELPDAPLKFIAGIQRLKNGNTVICNWLGHGQFGKAPHLIEVTPEKKVAWTYANHETMKTIAAVQFLDPPADAVAGEVCR